MVGALRQACLWTWPRHGPEQTGDSVKHMWSETHVKTIRNPFEVKFHRKYRTSIRKASKILNNFHLCLMNFVHHCPLTEVSAQLELNDIPESAHERSCPRLMLGPKPATSWFHTEAVRLGPAIVFGSSLYSFVRRPSARFFSGSF